MLVERKDLRVLHVLYSLVPYGQVRSTLMLANAQRRLYEGVRLVAIDGGEMEKELVASGLDYRILRQQGRVGSVGLVRLLVGELRTFRPDIVHLSIARVPYVLATAIAAWAAGIPVVGHIHSNPAARGEAAMGPIMCRLVRLLRGRFHWIILTEEARQLYLKRLGLDGFVVPNVVDLDDFDHKLRALPRTLGEDQTYRILCAAHLGPVKNHAMLLRAMQKVVASDQRARLYLAGDGPLREPLQDMAVELGIGEHVVFLGYRDDVPALMRDCDIVCLTSKAEGFGMVLIEAGAARKPCIVTDITGPREVVVDGVTGFVVPPDDDEALAERILQLSRDADLRRRMGEAARERVEKHYTLERQVALVDRVYREVLGR